MANNLCIQQPQRADSPLVTIIIPTLRRPQWLREALQSAVSQTYLNLQIIVSDNGSGDSTPKIVSEFNDPRIFFRQNTKTIPAIDHYHQCLSYAKGTYFLMLSDDDKISPGYIESMVELMVEFPQTTAAFGSSCTIDSQGRITQSRLLDKVWHEPGAHFLRDWFLHKRQLPTFSVISVFTRTDLVREYGGPPPFHNLSDIAFVISLALAGHVSFSHKGCFYYRVHAAGDCLTMSWTDRLESIKEFNQYLSRAPVLPMMLAMSALQRLRLKYSIDFGVAYSYLSQIYHMHSPKMSVFDLLRALLAYPITFAYLLCLPRFVFWGIRGLPRSGIQNATGNSAQVKDGAGGSNAV